MRRVLLVVSFAVMVLAPFVASRMYKAVFHTPTPPLPGISIPLATSPTPGAITPMSAADRVATVRKRYLEAKSYRDQGEQVNTISSTISSKRHATFSTAFERDARSLWAFRQSDEDTFGVGWLYVIRSSDQREFRLWWTLEPQQNLTGDLAFAVGVAQGVSSGNSAAIFPLLHGGRSPFSAGEGEPVDNGVELVEGVECVVLEFPRQQILTTTIWVDADHAIRKIRSVMKSANSDPSVTEVLIRPVFDQPIPEEVFAFDPSRFGK